MPINQQPVVVDGFQNNYVNVSGAILGELAKSAGTALGGVAKQGLSDLFGFSDPQEDYYKAMTESQRANTRRADVEQAEKAVDAYLTAGNAWDQNKIQTIAGRYITDPDQLQSFVEGVTDNPGYRSQRGQNNALNAGMDLMQGDRPRNVSTPISDALEGLTGYDSAPPPPTQVELPSSFQQASPKAAEPKREALLEVPAPVPTAVQLPTSDEQAPAVGAEALQKTLDTPSSAPTPRPLSPQETQEARTKLQAIQLNYMSYGALYRQGRKAIAEGVMDEKQTAAALQLAHMRHQEVEGLMRVVGPALGIPQEDMDGNPITGAVVEDRQAYLLWQSLLRAPEQLKLAQDQDPSSLKAMKTGADRWLATVGKLPLPDAARLTEQVDKMVKSGSERIDAMITFHEADRKARDLREANQGLLDLKRQELELAKDDSASVIKARDATTQAQQQRNRLFEKYGEQELQLGLEKAREELETIRKARSLAVTKTEQDGLAQIIAYADVAVREQSNRYNVFVTNQERQIARAQKAQIDASGQLADYQENMRFLADKWSTERAAAIKKTGPAKIDQWFAALPKDVQAAYAGMPREEAWYRFGSNQAPSAYLDYQGQVEKYRRIIQSTQDMIQHYSEQTPPEEAANSAGSLAKTAVLQKLLPKIQTELRSGAASTLRDAGALDAQMVALSQDPNLVNSIVADYVATGDGTARPTNLWSPTEQKALLTLVSGSRGRKSPEQLAQVPVPGGTLGKKLGVRYRQFYNSYVKLYNEIGGR